MFGVLRVLNWSNCRGMTTSYLIKISMHRNNPVWGADGAELEHLQSDDNLVFIEDISAKV